MATLPFPVHIVVDDAGAIVLGATVTIASVSDKDGNPVATHGATVSLAGANVVVNYDPAIKGDAWVALAISKNLSTFTGLNAAPRAFLVADSQSLMAVKAKTDQIVFTVANQVDCNVQSVDETEADPPATAAPLTTDDIPAIAAAAATLVATALSVTVARVATLLAAVESSQDGATVASGGTTSIAVAGLAIPVGNLKGMMCEVKTPGGAIKGRLPVDSAAPSGGNITLNFAAAGFGSAVTTSDTVVLT